MFQVNYKLEKIEMLEKSSNNPQISPNINSIPSINKTTPVQKAIGDLWNFFNNSVEDGDISAQIAHIELEIQKTQGMLGSVNGNSLDLKI